MLFGWIRIADKLYKIYNVSREGRRIIAGVLNNRVGEIAPVELGGAQAIDARSLPLIPLIASSSDPHIGNMPTTLRSELFVMWDEGVLQRENWDINADRCLSGSTQRLPAASYYRRGILTIKDESTPTSIPSQKCYELTCVMHDFCWVKTVRKSQSS